MKLNLGVFFGTTVFSLGNKTGCELALIRNSKFDRKTRGFLISFNNINRREKVLLTEKVVLLQQHDVTANF